MDPNTALEVIHNCLKAHEIDGAIGAGQALAEWLDKHGFEPQWKRFPIASRWFKVHRTNNFSGRR